MTQDSRVSNVSTATSAVARGPMPAIKRVRPCAKLAGDRRDQTADRRIGGDGEAGRRRAGSRRRRPRNPARHVRLVPAVHDQLREMAYTSRRSQHSLLLEALDDLFRKHGKPPIPS